MTLGWWRAGVGTAVGWLGGHMKYENKYADTEQFMTGLFYHNKVGPSTWPPATWPPRHRGNTQMQDIGSGDK